jgi:type II secretory pathway pseudopilin PulG
MSTMLSPCNLHVFRHQRGFMLLGLLIVLALAGISLMASVDVWTLQRQREREQQLLFVGDEYRKAIQRYYFAAPPGSPRTLPQRLELLLEDDRYPNPVRHLRRLYPDPMTGQTEWGEVRIGDRIAGVYSQSTAHPIKQAGFSPDDESFNGKSSYAEWIFSFTGSGAGANLPSAASVKAAEPPFNFSRPVLGKAK